MTPPKIKPEVRCHTHTHPQGKSRLCIQAKQVSEIHREKVRQERGTGQKKQYKWDLPRWTPILCTFSGCHLIFILTFDLWGIIGTCSGYRWLWKNQFFALRIYPTSFFCLRLLSPSFITSAPSHTFLTLNLGPARHGIDCPVLGSWTAIFRSIPKFCEGSLLSSLTFRLHSKPRNLVSRGTLRSLLPGKVGKEILIIFRLTSK